MMTLSPKNLKIVFLSFVFAAIGFSVGLILGLTLDFNGEYFLWGFAPQFGAVIAVFLLYKPLFKASSNTEKLISIAFGFILLELCVTIYNYIDYALLQFNPYTITTDNILIFWYPLLIEIFTLCVLFRLLKKSPDFSLHLTAALTASLFLSYIYLLLDFRSIRGNTRLSFVICCGLYLVLFALFYLPKHKNPRLLLPAFILSLLSFVFIHQYSDNEAQALIAYMLLILCGLMFYLLIPYLKRQKSRALLPNIGQIKNTFQRKAVFFKADGEKAAGIIKRPFEKISKKTVFILAGTFVLAAGLILSAVLLSKLTGRGRDEEAQQLAATTTTSETTPTPEQRTPFAYSLSKPSVPGYLVYAVEFKDNQLCLKVALQDYYDYREQCRLDLFDGTFNMTELEITDMYDFDTGLKWQEPYRCFARITTDVSADDPRLNDILDWLYRSSARTLIRLHPNPSIDPSATANKENAANVYYDTFADCVPLGIDSALLAEIFNCIKSGESFSLAEYQQDKNNFTTSQLSKVMQHYSAEIKPLSDEANALLLLKLDEYRLVYDKTVYKKTYLGDRNNYILAMTKSNDDGVYICVLGDSDTGVFKRKSTGAFYSEGDYFQDERANVYDLWIAKYDKNLNLLWKKIVKQNLPDNYDVDIYDFKMVKDTYDDMITLSFFCEQLSDATYTGWAGQAYRSVLYGNRDAEEIALYEDGELAYHTLMEKQDLTSTWSREDLAIYPYMHDGEMYVQLYPAEKQWRIETRVMKTSDGGYLIYGHNYNDAFAEYGDTGMHTITSDVFEQKYRSLFDPYLSDLPYADDYPMFTDVLVVKTDADFKVAWYRYCGGTGGDMVDRAVEGEDGRFYLIGETWSVDGDVAGYRPASEGEGGCNNFLVPKPAKWSFILSKDGQLVFSKCNTDEFYIIKPKEKAVLSDRAVFFEEKAKRIDDYSRQYYFSLYSAK